jgi:hypothetical protein
MSNFLSKVPGERFLYKSTKGIYYLRRRNAEEDTDECLDTKNKETACNARDDYVAELRNKVNGVAVSSQASAEKTKDKKIKRELITSILSAYVKAGHPRKKRPREKGSHLRQEEDAIPLLEKFFKGKHDDELDQDLLDDYHTWRVAKISKGTGDRTVDLDLNCLSNALNWAVRKKKIKVNPIFGRDKYYSPSKARHAKQVCPKSPEEMHDVARILFSDPRSEVLGWQMLIEACGGTRTFETVTLSMTAGPDEPGCRMGNSLQVRRAKKADRDNPYVHVHDDFLEILNAHKIWHAKRYPNSRWMFPGRNKGSGKHISQWALTTALERLFQKGLCRKITSHGMRAYFVLVERSNGKNDSQIAVEINHIGGLETLRTSYGVTPIEWLEGKGPKLTWLPQDRTKCAWLASKTFKGLRGKGRGRVGNTSGHQSHASFDI